LTEPNEVEIKVDASVGTATAAVALLAQSVGNCATALFVSLPTDRGRMILSPAVEMMLTK
jgi:hypothetical protein